MRFQRNTKKLKENHSFSWFGAAREHASETFFGELSLLGALWSTSGRFGDFGALCVGFGVLFGGFGLPLGAQRLDQGPLPGHYRARARPE